MRGDRKGISPLGELGMRAALLPEKEQRDDGGPRAQLSRTGPAHWQLIQGDSGKVSEVPMV